MRYYISPRFLDKLAVHITKNYLDLPGVKVPLILGIHGRKGEGKTFMCELVFERMGVEVVHVSAGELESPDAGDSARLIRLRYREAAELTRVRGRMAALMINDIDAGAGRVDEYTQYTVNTQLVNATLMNIADNPTNVQLPGSYELEPIQRIPIIVTGNDFSTLYAPMIRDGRMEKFFWDPDREDRIGIVSAILDLPGKSQEEVVRLIDTFPNQAIDFFSALRSRLLDEQIRDFIQSIGVDRISSRVLNSKDPLPTFFSPDFNLPHLIELGNQMVREQQRIQELRLVQEYNQPISVNRRLGEIERPRSDPPHSSPDLPLHDASFFRSYEAANHGQVSPAKPTTTSYAGQPSSTRLTPEIVTEVNRILTQGHRLAIEFVDSRRFRTGAWSCYGTYDSHGVQAIKALEACLDEHDRDYIRIVGINSKDRRRAIEMMIHRPQSVLPASPA
ncbi:MAG TPA: AAA family ATPase [Coleofasciculaceae cyanobacterium]